MCLLPPKCVLSINQPVSLCASPKEHRVPWGTPTSKHELTPGTILLAKGSGSSPRPSSTWSGDLGLHCVYVYLYTYIHGSASIDIKPCLPKMYHILFFLSIFY